MKIKKFKAKTFAEALALVKKELSENAVILSTEETKGLRSGVEVTAAVDFDMTDQEPAAGQAEDAAAMPVMSDGPASLVAAPVAALRAAYEGSAAPSPAPREGGGDELKKEIADLRGLLEGMKRAGFEMALPARKKAAMDFLTKRAVREEYALRISENVKELDDIPLLLSSDIRVKGRIPTKKAVMLIGPTGVGKTTTVAKLAAQSVKAGKKAAIVNLDTYRIGAVEQIRIYSRILGIPLAVAANAKELAAHLRALAASRDIIYVDTTGRNPLEDRFLAEVADACSVDVPLELHLLMSASSDDAFMMEAYKRYRKLPIDYLAFTKVDEAVRYGSLYNLIVTYGKPVSCVTTGQQVPGDIEFPTVSRLAGLIVTAKEC